jgi:hypothetical protein
MGDRLMAWRFPRWFPPAGPTRAPALPIVTDPCDKSGPILELNNPISETSMSELANLGHLVANTLVADFNALKAAILNSPEVASSVSGELNTLESTVNSAASLGISALASEAAAIPYFGAALAAAVTAAEPVAIADLQSAEQQAAAFIAALAAKA